MENSGCFQACGAEGVRGNINDVVVSFILENMYELYRTTLFLIIVIFLRYKSR